MAEPSFKRKELRDFQSAIMGVDVEDFIRRDICVNCKKPATQFDNPIAQHEFCISGLCQSCQTIAFAPPEDEK